METILIYILFALGVVLIVKGGDWFVDGASWIADASGIPKFIVGATIVSFATTLPELIVSCIATLRGSYEMAAGNAIGSVTANIALIMAISIIFMPMVIVRKKYIYKTALMLGALALLLVLSIDGKLHFLEALPVLAIFVLFVIENVYSARQELGEAEEKAVISRRLLFKNLILLVVGAACIVIGSQLLVNNGQVIARSMGISEAIISLTLMAVGTSLPELVTTVTAIIKKQPSLSVGNIVGANTIDLTMILPICTLLSGGSLIVENGTWMMDLPFALLAGSVALIPTLIRKKFSRVQGIILLALYVAYIVARIILFG